MKTILHKIQSILPELTQAQAKLAEYILANSHEVALMKLATLAKQANVSLPSVTRFATFLGYKGYGEFQKDLQKLIYSSSERKDEIFYLEKEEASDYITGMFKSIDHIADVFKKRDIATIHRAAKSIFESDIVICIGDHESQVLRDFTFYNLSKYKQNVHTIADNDFILHDILAQEKKICAIVIAFYSYSAKTIEYLNHLKTSNASIILLTDNDFFAFADRIDMPIYISSPYSSSINPYVVAICILNEMIIYTARLDMEIAKKNKDRFTKYMLKENIPYEDIEKMFFKNGNKKTKNQDSELFEV